MAVDMEALIMDGLLNLCGRRPLKAITVKDILAETGVSRQTFYNYFQDKNDLIQRVYLKRIIPDFQSPDKNLDFSRANLAVARNVQAHRDFLRQACMLEGQNCLREFMFSHCKELDLTWHQMLYGGSMPEKLRFATEYHAVASISMLLTWILSGASSGAEEVAAMITRLRDIGLGKLLAGRELPEGPYKPHGEQTI